MARQWRIEFPGAIYHILSRGNGRQNIFRSDGDRRLFLDLIEELSDRYDIEVYAYVLMGNHYHLLVKTHQANLSRAMQWFGTSYTCKFNLRNGARGHLFQGRFKSIIVENDSYLLRLSCYIHRNPLRAGLVERLADYPWSSYRFYAYGKRPPGWLATGPILTTLAGSGADPHKAYRIKVQLYALETRSVWEDLKHGIVLGGQQFAADLKSRFGGCPKDEELPQRNRLLRDFDPEPALRRASEMLSFDIDSARAAGKIAAADKETRDLLMYWLRATGRLSHHQIGAMFGVTYSAVSKAVGGLSERLRTDPALRERLQGLNSIFKV